MANNHLEEGNAKCLDFRAPQVRGVWASFAYHRVTLKFPSVRWVGTAEIAKFLLRPGRSVLWIANLSAFLAIRSNPRKPSVYAGFRGFWLTEDAIRAGKLDGKRLFFR